MHRVAAAMKHIIQALPSNALFANVYAGTNELKKQEIVQEEQ